MIGGICEERRKKQRVRIGEVDRGKFMRLRVTTEHGARAILIVFSLNSGIHTQCDRREKPILNISRFSVALSRRSKFYSILSSLLISLCGES